MSLAKAVSNVRTICQTTFPREIELACAVAKDVGLVSMPESELEQLLLNMLFNARDALEDAPGDRRISVVVDRVVTGGAPWARLRIADTGVGMPEEVRRKLGEPFFTTKAPHKGSGLGLASAFARVREVGGRVECESAPGRGTTFTLFLPEAVALARTEAPNVLDANAILPGKGETLLLVDDEPLVRSAVRMVLEGEGYVVLEAASANEARTVLDRERDAVRLVILDQSMPMESGLAALPSLRTRTQVPIILFTGLTPHGTPSDVVVLEKPARPAEIRRLVRELLDR
jgi:CheY-like chemotaxis protein